VAFQATAVAPRPTAAVQTSQVLSGDAARSTSAGTLAAAATSASVAATEERPELTRA
jgi:hypothetical protein